MTRVLEDLYFGEFQPSYHHIDREEYCRADTRAAETEEVITRVLEGKEKQLFLNYTDDQNTICGEIGLQTFLEGVRFGARFILDIL